MLDTSTTEPWPICATHLGLLLNENLDVSPIVDTFVASKNGTSAVLWDTEAKVLPSRGELPNCRVTAATLNENGRVWRHQAARQHRAHRVRRRIALR